MINTEKTYIKTPRGNIRINVIFESEEEARKAGYGYWFTHEGTKIYGNENPCLKAIVK